MRASLAQYFFVGIALTVPWSGGRHVVEQILPAAHAQETPADSLSAQLRRQGHRCEGPIIAERDAELSKPDELVWVIRCANATYRMRLVPHMAAQVEQI
jgi:hypothetical protein